MIYDKEKLVQETSEFLATIHPDDLMDSLYCSVIDGDWEMADTERHRWMKGGNSVFQTIAYGLTKIVLFPKDMQDVVVKIPFIGINEYAYTENDDLKLVGRVDFSGLKSGDYCERESTVYKNAVQAHLEKFFACTEYVADALGFVPIYASERCDPLYSDGMTNRVCLSALSGLDVPNDVVKVLARQYGEDELMDLEAFLLENNVSDLHEGNWGYGKDGKLKIIDYSSFYETFKD